MNPLEFRSDTSDERFEPEPTDRFEREHAERFEREGLAGTEVSHRDRPLSEFREQFAEEYTVPWERPVTAERFPQPERIVGDINPKFRESLSYRVNAGDCARAVERTWRGDRETAAGRRTLESEPPDRMESWAGQPLKSVELQDIHDRVAAAGYGSSAIVQARHVTPEGKRIDHVYNVVNNYGTVKVVDGQVGQVYSWNAETGHPGLSNVSDFSGNRGKSMTVGWDAKRRSLW